MSIAKRCTWWPSLEPNATEKRFRWCCGDMSPRTGRCVALPFDAVWEDRKLIIEIDEDQHREITPHFDKPDKLTVSGVHRGEQRRRYDERKRTAAATNGYHLVRISRSRRQRQDRPADLAEVRRRLLDEGVELERAQIRTKV